MAKKVAKTRKKRTTKKKTAKPEVTEPTEEVVEGAEPVAADNGKKTAEKPLTE